MDMNKKQPLDNLQWIDRNTIAPNPWNPNKVAPPEMKLLKISILEDGWTQPIVLFEILPGMFDNLPPGVKYIIVDGFHRWTLSGEKDFLNMTAGNVPCVVLSKHKTKADLMMATIRHNRARGTHGVLAMAEIMQEWLDTGVSGEEIMERMEMEEEEVTRLAMRVGIPKTELFKDMEFSKSWKPKGL